MKTRLMIKKTMTITSLAILFAAISVATTMTMVQANPVDDLVDISVSGATPPAVVQVTVVTPGPEYIGEFVDPANPITVNLEDGTVWIDVDSGVPIATGVIDIHIQDIDWVGLTPIEDGAIISVSCEIDVDEGGPVTLPSALFTRDSIWITVDTASFEETPFEVHCTYEVVHGDLEKSLVDCDAIPIKEEEATECTFNISYNGPRATIIDTVSAAWEEEPIVFDPDECMVDVDPVTNEKGKNKKGNNKSATGITCDDVGTSADIDITVTTRESPATVKHQNKVDKFKPTECGDFEINGGAKAILLDGSGNVVFDTGSNPPIPIVIIQTDPLFVEAIENTDLGFECELPIP